MTIAIISAEDFELTGIRAKMNDSGALTGLPVRHAYRALWRGHDVVLCANGPGFPLAAAAAAAVIDHAKPDRVWSVGLCGGLDAKLSVGDVVTGWNVFDPNSGDELAALPFPDSQGVTIVSQDRVAVTAAEKSALASMGSVVEMESAAVARVARDMGIAFQCVKVVSDTVDETISVDLNGARDAEGRFAGLRVAGQAMKNPVSGFRELAGLYRRSRHGADRLGEWIDNCRI